MFSTTWKTSERKYGVAVERNRSISMSDGIKINADIFRPDDDQRFPAILGMHCYQQEPQTAPIKPNSFSTGIFLHPMEEKQPICRWMFCGIKVDAMPTEGAIILEGGIGADAGR